MAAFWIMSRVPTFPWFSWYFSVMSALFSSSGHHSTVREESFPYSLQKLHVNVCSEGQSWGQLHDHHDCHYGSWEKEPRGKHGYNEDMFRHKSLRFPQKTILCCSFRTLLLSVGFVEKVLLPLLSLCMHSFEEMYSITWLLNYGVIRGINFLSLLLTDRISDRFFKLFSSGVHLDVSLRTACGCHQERGNTERRTGSCAGETIRRSRCFARPSEFWRWAAQSHHRSMT